MKAAIPADENERVEDLASYEVLDTPAETAFDDVTRLAAHICDTPIALVSLIDAERQWFKSARGLEIAQMDRGIAICAHAILQRDLFMVSDLSSDPRFSRNPLVTGELHLRSYASAPLVNSRGHALGTLCVADRVPRELSPAQQDALQALARQTVAQLELRKRSLDLERELGRRERAEESLRVRTEQSERYGEVLLELARSRAGSIDEALAQITRASSHALGAGRVSVWLFGEGGRSLECQILYERASDAFCVEPPLSSESLPAYFSAIAERRVISAEDALGNPATAEFAESYLRPRGITSMLDVPVWRRGEMVGVVCHEHIGPRRAWTVDEEEFAASIADFAAGALEARDRRLATAELERRERQLAQAQTLANLGSWEWEVPTGALAWSDELRRIYGVDGSEHQPSFEDYLARVDERDRTEAREQIERAMRTGESFSMVERIRRPDGAVRVLRSVVEPRPDANGIILTVIGVCQDVTEVMRTERARHISETRFRAMFEQFPLSVQIFDPGGRTLEVNRAWNDLFGLDIEDTRSYNPLADPQLAGVRALLERGFGGETLTTPPHPFQPARVRDASADPAAAEAKWLEVSVCPVRNPLGDIREVIMIHRDVTDRERAAAETRASERRYRALVQATTQAVWAFQSGRTWDQATIDWWSQITGQTPGAASGWGWLDAVHPEDRVAVRKAWERALATGTVYRSEYRVRGAAGEYLHFAVRGVPIEEAGEISEWVGTFTDITARMQAEHELRLRERELADAQELAKLGSWRWAIDRAQLTWSVEMFRIAGIDPGGEPMDMDRYFDLIHPADRDAARDEIIKALHDCTPFRFQHRIIRPDGAIRFLDGRGEVVPGEDGCARLMWGTAQDITELKEAEERLREAHDELETRVAERTAELAETNEALEEEIAERERAEQELLERTGELEGIFRALPDLYFRMTRGGTILDYRAGRAQSLYLPPDQFVGKDVTAALPPGVAEKIAAALDEIERTNELVCTEYSLPAGEEALDFEARLVPSADGQVIAVIRDVTSQREAERALKRSEERFRLLIENSSDVATILDSTGTNIYQSPSVEGALGYTPEEMAGTSAFERIHPDDHEVTREALGRMVATPGTTHRAEFRYRHKDGAWRVLEATGRTLLPDSAEAGVIVNSRDVSERKRAQAELQRREERFRSLIENGTDLITITNADGRIEYQSPSVERVLGYAPAALVGTSAFSLIHAEDVERTRGIMEAAMQQPGSARAVEFRFRHQNGEWRTFEGIGKTVLADSAAEGLVINSRDITERKESEEALRRSEEHFRALIQHAHDITCIIDPNGSMLYLSPSVKGVLGYEPTELTGESAFGYIHPEDAPQVAGVLGDIVAVPGSTGVVEYRFRSKDGGWRTLEAFGKTLSPNSTDEGLVINIRDVTERKAAQQALRASEESFRGLFDTITELVYIQDLEGKFLNVNEAVVQAYGYTLEEIVGRTPAMLADPARTDMDQSRAALEAAIAGEPQRFEWWGRRKDGSTFPKEVVLTRSVYFGEDVVIAVARDVTDRRAAEAAVARSEEHFRSLIQNASDLVSILDAQGIIRFQSAAVTRLFGYEADEMTGVSGFDWIHPDDIQATYQAFGEVVASPGTTRTVEYRFRHRDGHWVYTETTGRTLLPGSAAEGVVMNSRDITERKESEQALRLQKTLLEAQGEASIDGILVVSAAGEMLSFNRRFVEMWEIPKEIITARSDAAAIGWVLDQLEDAAEFSARIEHLYAHPEQESRDEIRLFDGRVFDRYSAPVRSDQGDHYGRIWFFRDITERTRFEQALRDAKIDAEQAREAAEAANRAKSEFLSRMSHELRTPMNSILGFAQLLARKELPADQRKGVEHILKAGRHLLNLINEVLDIARIEANRQQLSLEPVRVRSALQEALNLIRPLAAQRDCVIDDDLLDCEDRFVHADRQKLAQVLINLLSNAVKYNRPEGFVSISCSLLGSGEEGRLAIGVHDSGPGIQPERMDELFVPFSRLGAEHTDIEGTGLGLALSQRLTEAMGGSLRVQSVVGEGSTFWVELPLAEDPAAHLARSSAPASGDAERPGVPKTILYIEDNLANFSLVESIFDSRPEVKLLAALQGRLGVELAREHRPDLILLDLHLPDIGGEDVLRRLQADSRTSDIPVIIVSADTTPRQIDRLLEAGAVAYITKPLEVDRFVSAVDRCLKKPEN